MRKNNIRKVSFVTDTFTKNNFFNSEYYNRDDYLEFLRQLKVQFYKIGVDLSTSDIISPNESDAIIQYGMNVKTLTSPDKKYHYLLALESPLIDTSSVDARQHKGFNKIFTWNDDWIDNEKYFKVNDAHKFPGTVPKKYNNKKLCCMISGNKAGKFRDSNELYSKRIQFIRWFEKNHLEEFDLYGTNWNQYRYGHSFFGRVLNKIKFLRKSNNFPSYKGVVESKFETMKNYQFSICYENIKDQSGYITEKIFDSFFAGCVPIYWGAKNITDHIPSECFIDKRNFSSLDEIYLYIKNMGEFKYMEYLNSIENFLGSSQADPFRAEVFAETIVKEIMEDFNESV